MADQPPIKTGQDLNIELRRVLNDAYGFVVGQQATQAFGAVTYEQLADQEIERIVGAGTSLRPNEIDRIQKMEQDLTSMIQQIRDIPPERFILANQDSAVNTDPMPPED